MKHTIIEKAALKAKSEELGIPFSNLLAGYVLEELMYLIANSPFSLFLWLKNSYALGIEQYKEKNILTLDFAYITDRIAMKKEGIVPGQELTLKMGYVMLAYILKEDRVPEISWKGRAWLNGEKIELEITGELEEMTVPIHIRISKLEEEGLSPVKREFPLFMQNNRKVPYLEYPVESILAEQLYHVMKNMELIPQMSSYDRIYQILKTDAINGRHIREMMYHYCKEDELVPEITRMEMILSYRNYTYMRKRWEKYLRHKKKDGPAWDEIMDILTEFLPRIWESICNDRIVTGDWMPDLGRFLD